MPSSEIMSDFKAGQLHSGKKVSGKNLRERCTDSPSSGHIKT